MKHLPNCATPILLTLVVTLASAAVDDPNPQSTGQASDGANAGALKSMSLEQLSQVQVTTPSQQPQKAFRAPVAIFVITGEDIRRSGATSIPEALRMAPGVEVARIDGSKWAIGIRGFQGKLSRSILVLIDGRVVYSPLFAGTYWDVQDTFLDDIDRIEVIRGPGATIWGPNAVNGVINVITKDSSETHGIRAAVAGGNEEQGLGEFRYGGGNGSTFDYRFFAKGFTDGPESHPDHQNYDDWRETRAGLRMDWEFGGDNKVTVEGDAYAGEAGERTSVVTYAPPFQRLVDSNADLSGGDLLARWTHDDGKGNNIQVQAYYDRNTREEANLDTNVTTFDVDFAQLLLAPDRQKFSWGLETRVSDIGTPPVVSGINYLPYRRNDWLATGFVQDEWEFVPDQLTLTVGTKVIRTNFTGIEPEPSVRLAWTPDTEHTIWAAFTHALRTAADAEEDLTQLGFIGIARGIPYFERFNLNPNFQPERLNSTEFGYRQLVGKRFFLDFTSYLNHYHDAYDEDLIGNAFAEPQPAPPHYILPLQFGNGLLGRTYGFEIAPEWRPTDKWRLRASYSYLRVEIEKQPGGRDIGSSPNLNGSSAGGEASFQSEYDVSKNLQLDFDVRYVSALPALKVAAYTTGNIHFAWRLNGRLQLTAVGENLFQPSHVEYAADPDTLVGIIRSGYLKLTWTQ